jgi:prepilin-type N-terminal cleavage/methylation domain-containing protein
MQRNQKGFTLMELMVVIVIVAILAAVAVPLYINYVRDAQRTEAKGAIGAVITAEQTYFQGHPPVGGDPNSGYQTDLTKLNVDLTDVAHNWTITIPAADANGFTVLANGTGAANGLTVQVVYSRAASPVWTES